MATGSDVLMMLAPNTEWVIYGDDFDSIQWIKGEQITKAQFEAGFAQYDAWKAEQDAKEQADKTAAQAKLAALGLTADDLQALGL
jgi:ketosteroid isomerase-like protein